ncbi:unnamed protein product [Rhizoctonia solani]|uniref:Uncharacterized protein n=1 Tax=Rhizoctonia solani TaxID=456999 RepID=A0A8H2WBN1_9AGAM|nr:unnamed protein product [Rhizoctonia solani]
MVANNPIYSAYSSASSKLICKLRMAPYPGIHHSRKSHPVLSKLGHEALGDLAALALPSLQQLFKIFSQIPLAPSNPTAAFLSSSQFEDCIMAHCDQMLAYLYFKPIKDQKAQYLELVTSRLRSSWIARLAILLDARVCESIIEDTFQPHLYDRLIGDLEVAIKTVLAWDPTSPEAYCITAMKTVVGPSSNMIQVLQSATPTFLQTAYSCPELWANNSDSTFIPLLNTAVLERHELTTFAFIDCICAMVFGVPQQVDYDTSTNSCPVGPLPFEWSHGCPMEFLLLLAEINACRDKRPDIRDWREIEHQLVTWLARPCQHDETWESCMAVAWLAVQESWRLTLLAYLYLAVCGASSDEPRVQLCISQLLQVVNTVKNYDSPEGNVPFFIQYLMVGICANRENHRRIVWKQLSNKSQTKFWRLRATDFVPVLDHLWHGAGSDGNPIKWCDYVHSRETMIPVAV